MKSLLFSLLLLGCPGPEPDDSSSGDDSGDTWSSTPGCFHGELQCQVEGHTLSCAEDCTFE